MNVRKWLLSLSILAAVAALAAPAHAMTWGGDVFAAFSAHTMDDWNADIEDINQSGGNADEIKSSLGGGLGLRLLPNPSWMFEGTWEPIFASTEEKVTDSKIEPTANSFQLTGTYFFPSASKGKFGLGAGVGFYNLNGTLEVPTFPEVEIGGSGIGFHFLGTGEWEVSPGFNFFGAAGYRVAKITDTEFDGEDAAARGEPKYETDFSGLTVRAGLAFYAPSSSR
jgi:hypothetical protein